MTMDPISLISTLPVPPEWMVPLILIALAYKGWQLWMLENSKSKRDDDDVTPAVG